MYLKTESCPLTDYPGTKELTAVYNLQMMDVKYLYELAEKVNFASFSHA